MTDTLTDTITFSYGGDTPGPVQPDREQLEELDDHIRQAKADAEDALGQPDQPLFVESGERGPDEDDQTIAPPG